MEDKSKQAYQIIFGESLRRLRIHADLSQEDLAERAGVDRSYLGGIERGEHNVALINIIKIAKALNLPPHMLLECFASSKERE